MGAAGSDYAAKMTEVKSLVIAASLVAGGVWCLHGVVARTRVRQLEEKQVGDIVIARAPDGSLSGRWQGATPAPVPSK
jgi:hypothetical protein